MRYVARRPLVAVALLVAVFCAALSPQAPAEPSALVIEKAQHVVNPIYGGSEVPQAELHGDFAVRNAARVPVTDVKLVVHLLEKTTEYPLGALAPNATAATEWSMVCTGNERPPVTLDLYGRLEGRRIHLVVESREVAPPPPQGPPGGPPPGY